MTEWPKRLTDDAKTMDFETAKRMLFDRAQKGQEKKEMSRMLEIKNCQECKYCTYTDILDICTNINRPELEDNKHGVIKTDLYGNLKENFPAWCPLDKGTK